MSAAIRSAWGATDGHTAPTTAKEARGFCEAVSVEPSPKRVLHLFPATEFAAFEGHWLVAPGYTVVWAVDNTREALFDAFKWCETYATEGPRIGLRLFGEWAYVDADLRMHSIAEPGYTKGELMGLDLRKGDGANAPSFLTVA